MSVSFAGFRHECTDAGLRLRAKYFVEMRRLVRKDRLLNDADAEPARLLTLGVENTTSTTDMENQHMQSGGIVDSEEDDDESQSQTQEPSTVVLELMT